MNTKYTLVLVLTSVAVGIVITYVATLPIRGYIAMQNEKITELEKQVHDYDVCTMDVIVCDFEKETPAMRD